MCRFIKTVSLASGLLLLAGVAFAQAQNNPTTGISRDSPAAKGQAERAVKTRDDMEKTQPLDWNKTISTPKRVAPTAEELRAQANSKPAMVEGGAPIVQDDELRQLPGDNAWPARADDETGKGEQS